MTDNHPYTFHGGIITVLRNNVLLIEYTVDKVDLDHVISTRDKRKELIGDTPYYAINDLRNGFVTFSKEAKEFIANDSESSKARLQDYALVASWGTKLEVQVYLTMHKPKVPTKVVRSLEKALEDIDSNENS